MFPVKKKYYTWEDVEKMSTDIVCQMFRSNWKPDYVIGITRGGLTPAVLISHMIDVPCETLKVSLSANQVTESNCWMAEDACGSEHQIKKNILIVDDINDTGNTFNWIKNDWSSSVFDFDSNIWHNNVKFAVLTNNLASKFNGEVDFCSDAVNKDEDNVWLVYPWERS